MSFEIRSARVDSLARELADATGEDLEIAVERAIEERLARIPRVLSKDRQAKVDALFDRLSQLPVRDDRLPDEIIGYGSNGVPE